MKVFVAGASGVIGRPLVRRLVAAGHTVTGMTSRERNAAAIEAAGGRAVVCDALDPDAVKATVAEAAPEVVISQLTRLPADYNPRKIDYGPSNRARAGGRAQPDRRRARGGSSAVRLPEHRLHLRPGGGDGQGRGGEAVDRRAGAVHRRRQVDPRPRARCDGGARDRRPGAALRAVLRAGHLLRVGRKRRRAGPSSVAFRSSARAGGRSRSSTRKTPPRPRSRPSSSGAPGIYNVVDDEPAAERDWLPVYAEALGAKPPRKVPTWLARIVAGRFAVIMATELRGASNAKAKQELGWQPTYASWRAGFARRSDSLNRQTPKPKETANGLLRT